MRHHKLYWLSYSPLLISFQSILAIEIPSPDCHGVPGIPPNTDTLSTLLPNVYNYMSLATTQPFFDEIFLNADFMKAYHVILQNYQKTPPQLPTFPIPHNSLLSLYSFIVGRKIHCHPNQALVRFEENLASPPEDEINPDLGNKQVAPEPIPVSRTKFETISTTTARALLGYIDGYSGELEQLIDVAEKDFTMTQLDNLIREYDGWKKVRKAVDSLLQLLSLAQPGLRIKKALTVDELGDMLLENMKALGLYEELNFDA